MSPQIKYAYKRHNTWILPQNLPQGAAADPRQRPQAIPQDRGCHPSQARVAELNQTFAKVVAEAQDSMPRQGDALGSSPTETSSVLPTAAQAPRLGVARPRYQRARLVGDGLVAELAQAYLTEASQRLRPGSYKSVRFALELLCSHLGHEQVGALTQAQGKEVLGYITQLSPNVRKYREGKEAGLAELATLSQEQESTTLAPQTQARILKQMSQFLDWCVGEGELQTNPWAALKVKDRPEVHPHGMLSDAQVRILLSAKDRVLHSALSSVSSQVCAQGRSAGSWRRTSQPRATWGASSASSPTGCAY